MYHDLSHEIERRCDVERMKKRHVGGHDDRCDAETDGQAATAEYRT